MPDRVPNGVGHRRERYWSARETAVLRMGAARNPEALQPLLAALTDVDPSVRQAAARALGELGLAGAAPALECALFDGDRDVRLAAVQALGAIGDSRAVHPLIGLLGSDDGGLRHAAINALASIGEPAVAPLMRALGDRRPEVRRGAALALDRLGEGELARALLDAVANAEAAARDRRLGPAAAALVRAVTEREADVRMAARSATAGAPGAEAVAVAMKAIRDAEAAVQLATASLVRETLASRGDVRAVVPLLRLAEASSRRIRSTVADAFASSGAWAVDAALDALSDADAGIRAAAAVLLGAMRGESGRALSALRARASRDPSRDVRAACQRAIWEIERALGDSPRELIASPLPAGTGTELLAADEPPS